MQCPFCRGDRNHVIDSRMTRDGSSIRRRRHCEGCGRRFTTYERVEESAPVIVKKDGAREPFNRGKLVAGIAKACEKRPVRTADVEAFIDQLETRLTERPDRETSSAEVGERVMEFLRQADQVAYVRFASVYRSFEDISQFMDQLESLLEQGGRDRGRRAASLASAEGATERVAPATESAAPAAPPAPSEPAKPAKAEAPAKAEVPAKAETPANAKAPTQTATSSEPGTPAAATPTGEQGPPGAQGQ